MRLDKTDPAMAKACRTWAAALRGELAGDIGRSSAAAAADGEAVQHGETKGRRRRGGAR